MDKLTSKVLCNEIIKRFGNEDKQPDLKEVDQAILKLLKAAIHFFPELVKGSADLTNIVFIFWQPGKRFAIKAGKWRLGVLIYRGWE